MVKRVIAWLAEAFGARLRVSFGLPVLHIGKLYRADAKAQGDLVVLGGWEDADQAGTTKARWYSMRLAKAGILGLHPRGPIVAHGSP